MTTTASLLSAAGGIGRLSRSASRVVGKTASGFHLLRVEAYSQTKTVPAGQSIVSTPFSIGKYKWGFKYYPNGRDTTTKSDYISLYLQLYDHNSKKHQLQAQYKLSVLDHAGNVAYGLPAKTSVFKSSGDEDGDDSDDEEPQLCGHEQFIRREDLERREDLLKDDCVVFRCDVGGLTELETTCLAREDSDSEQVRDDDVFGLKPSRYRSSDSHHRRLRRADDNEFVQWCLAQKRMGS